MGVKVYNPPSPHSYFTSTVEIFSILFFYNACARQKHPIFTAKAASNTVMIILSLTEHYEKPASKDEL